MAEFRRIAETSDIPEGQGKIFELNGNQIAVWNVGGLYHAFQNMCPHRGGPVGEGELEGNLITCPWHGWQFDLTTCENTFNPQAKISKYDVKVEGTEIHILV